MGPSRRVLTRPGIPALLRLNGVSGWQSSELHSSDSVEKFRVINDATGRAFDGRIIHASKVRHDWSDAVGGDAVIRTLAHSTTDKRRAVRYGRGHLVVAGI